MIQRKIGLDCKSQFLHKEMLHAVTKTLEHLLCDCLVMFDIDNQPHVHVELCFEI